MSAVQKERRNFRKNKNNREHKLKQKNDELDAYASKLEAIKKEFAASLKRLAEFEESNIFSRDDDDSICDVLMENELLQAWLTHYDKCTMEQRENHDRLQDAFSSSLIGEINENTLNLNSASVDLELFYDGIDVEFADDNRFRAALIEKLNALQGDLGAIAPLIFGKKIQSPLKIAVLFSTVYAHICLEKKRYEKIKKLLRKHQHDVITIDGVTETRGGKHASRAHSKYQITDLKGIEIEIGKLRKRKCEWMKSLIERVYRERTQTDESALKALKLKQVYLHYKDSLLDDHRMSIKLQSELLQVECQEFLHALIEMEKSKEIAEAKQSQLDNALDIFLQSMKMPSSSSQNAVGSGMSSKQTNNNARNELSRLQNVDREQKKCIHATESEIANLLQLVQTEQQKQTDIVRQQQQKKRIKMQKRNKISLQTSVKDANSAAANEPDDALKAQVEALRQKLEAAQTKRKQLEETWDQNNARLQTQTQQLHSIQSETSASEQQHHELRRMIHQYTNHMNGNQFLSETASRKNSEALEFVAEMNFMNKEHGLRFDDINQKYREKQTFLRNKFLSEYPQQIKRNSKNRQTQIEQESFNIIMQRKDNELTQVTQSLSQHLNNQKNQQQESGPEANIDDECLQLFSNTTRPVQIRFGGNTIVSDRSRQSMHMSPSSLNLSQLNNSAVSGRNDRFDVIQPITFLWDDADMDRQEREEEEEDDDMLSGRDEEKSDDTMSSELDDDDDDGDSISDGDDSLSVTGSVDIEDADNINDNDQHEDGDGTDDHGNEFTSRAEFERNYQSLVKDIKALIDSDDVDLYSTLNEQMAMDEVNHTNVNEAEDEHECMTRSEQSDCLQFDGINFVQELLCNFTSRNNLR